MQTQLRVPPSAGTYTSMSHPIGVQETAVGQRVRLSRLDGTMVTVRERAGAELTEAAGRLRSYRLFGGVSATVSGVEVDLVGPKPRLVLAVLALEAGRTVS